MARYKAEQGTYARTSTFWMLAALLLFGCRELYYWLLAFRGDADTPGGLATDLAGGALPVLGIPLTPALLIALGLALAILIGLRRLLDRPKVADMLIDAETELRKCTWPSWNETFTSSLVILVVMVFFMAFLAGSDYILNVVIREYVF